MFVDDISGGGKVRHLLLRSFMLGMSSIGIASGFLFLLMNHEPFYIYNSLKKVLPIEGPVYVGIFGVFDAVLNSYLGCTACQVAFLVQYAYMINNKSWLLVVG